MAIVPVYFRYDLFAGIRVVALVWTVFAIANIAAPRWVWRHTWRRPAGQEPTPLYFCIRRAVALGMLLLALAFFGLAAVGG